MFTQKTIASTNAVIVVELGFVPTKIVVENVDTRVKLEWSSLMTAGEFIKTVAAGTRTLETSALPITIIDGSDKTNYVSKSYGFVLGTYADINDGTATGEHLIIEAYREDQV